MFNPRYERVGSWVVFIGVVVLSLMVGYCTNVKAEGSMDIIPRPEGHLNPYMGPSNNTVGNGITYELKQPTPLECDIIRPTPESELLENPYLDPDTRWIINRYDANGDGVVDAVTRTNPGTFYPRWYEFDIDWDGSPDIVFIDVKMNGECDGVILYCKRGDPECTQLGVAPPTTQKEM